MQHGKTHTSWQKPCGMSFAMPWPLPWWYSKTHASDTLLWHEFCHAMTFPMDAIGFQEFSNRPAFGTVHCNEKLALTVLHQLHCTNCTVTITLQNLHWNNYTATITQHNVLDIALQIYCTTHIKTKSMLRHLSARTHFPWTNWGQIFFLVRKYYGSTKQFGKHFIKT